MSKETLDGKIYLQQIFPLNLDGNARNCSTGAFYNVLQGLCFIQRSSGLSETFQLPLVVGNNNLSTEVSFTDVPAPGQLRREELPLHRFGDITTLLKPYSSEGDRFINIADSLFDQVCHSNEVFNNDRDDSNSLLCHETFCEGSDLLPTSFSSTIHSMSKNSEGTTNRASVKTELARKNLNLDLSVHDMAPKKQETWQVDCDSPKLLPVRCEAFNHESICPAGEICPVFISSSTPSPSSNFLPSSEASPSCSQSVHGLCEIKKHKKMTREKYRKHNQCERLRIKNLSIAYEKLKQVIPKFKYQRKQISQFDILQEAITYIHHLEDRLDDHNVRLVVPSGASRDY